MTSKEIDLELTGIIATHDVPAGFASWRAYVLGRGYDIVKALRLPAPAATSVSGGAADWLPIFPGADLPPLGERVLLLNNYGAVKLAPRWGKLALDIEERYWQLENEEWAFSNFTHYLRVPAYPSTEATIHRAALAAAPASVTSPQNEAGTLMIDEAQSMFKKLENDLLNWVRNKADREYTAATIAKFGQRVIEHLKQVAAPQAAPSSIQQVLEKWAEVRPGELDEDAVPLFMDELKLAGLQLVSVLQPAEKAVPALATFVQQAYAYKSTFPGLPEGYTHEDIDRLYEWANGADDLLRTAPQMLAASVTSPVEPAGDAELAELKKQVDNMVWANRATGNSGLKTEILILRLYELAARAALPSPVEGAQPGGAAT